MSVVCEDPEVTGLHKSSRSRMPAVTSENTLAILGGLGYVGESVGLRVGLAVVGLVVGLAVVGLVVGLAVVGLAVG
jgi:hypothetical protein